MKCDRCDKSLEETLVYVVGHNHGWCIACLWEYVREATSQPRQTKLDGQ